MKLLGLWIFIYGVFSIIHHVFNLDFRIYEWLEKMSSLYAWLIRIFMIVIGLILLIKAKFDSNSEDTFFEALSDVDWTPKCLRNLFK